MIKDIQTDSAQGNVHYPTLYNGKIYFAAYDGGTFWQELWEYDGTDATLTEDIKTGFQSSNPSNFAIYNGNLVFKATFPNGVGGTEVGQFDGTTVSMLSDVRPGSSSSYPGYLEVYDNDLYFMANNGTNGYELTKFDGVSSTLVQDINPGSSNGLTVGLTAFNGDLYFSADDGVHGRELWKYNATLDTAVMVADIRSGSASSMLTGEGQEFKIFNNELYFQANDGTNGAELWKYDGTTLTMLEVATGSQGGSPRYLTVLDDKLYFSGYTQTDGIELMSYDGTTFATAANIRSGGGSSQPTYIAAAGDALYFHADDGSGNGYELWKYTVPRQTAYFVDINATGLNDGTTWANAYTSLQEGMDSVLAGDTLMVAEGTYFPNKDISGAMSSSRSATFYINKNITIQGGYPTGGGTMNPMDNKTILSGDLGAQGDASDNSYNVIYLRNASSTLVLDGLTIEHGNANGSPYPYNRGGGIANNGMNSGNSSPTIQNCIFRWNMGTYGGAISNMSNYGGAIDATITGCLFYENTSAVGSAISNGTYQGGSNNSIITNCTFADNVGTSIHNANGGATITVQNSIIWDQGAPLYNYGNEVTVQYCLVKSTVLPARTTDGGNNSFSINPQFTDAANDDYSLKAFSVGVNIGSNGLLPVDYTSDLLGGTRTVNTTVDLGAIERAMAPAVIYVNHLAAGSNNGTSWTDAYTSLRVGLDAASSGTSIWIASGTYMPTSNTDRAMSFEVASGIKVYGGFAGVETIVSQRDWAANPTILSGDLGAKGDPSDNSYNVIRMQNAPATTLLDGLIIQDGNANGTPYPYNRGGGFSNNGMNSGNSSPTIQNCIFRWNMGTYGGAISNMSNFNGTVNATITGCLFYENTSTTGSAISNGTYRGGSNNSVITNCTFADNTGTSIHNANGGASITVQNSIIWDAGAPLYNYANEATVQHCILVSGALPARTIDGGNNLFATDPMFVDAANDDYKLQGASPAVGAGSNAYLPADYTLDLAYTTRQNGATVEIGCYEDGVSSAKTMANNNPTTVDANTSAEEEQAIETVIEEEPLEEAATVMNMTVYPNPVQDIVNIRLAGIQETVNLQVINTAGQTIQQEVLDVQEGETIQLDMSRLANGIYLLNVQLNDGTRLNERVIKF
ncbi:MAG: T9SS type A sorting domain-containing protein [Aureispira sp.]|nr:T9SS type A sorting domain-containing protein [Aureispira sp.]